MKSFEGYLKQTAGDTYLLLAGGGIKPLSDFFDTTTSDGRYVKKTGDDMSGALHIKADAAYYHWNTAGTTLYSYIGHDPNLNGSWWYNGVSGKSILSLDNGTCLINMPTTITGNTQVNFSSGYGTKYYGPAEESSVEFFCNSTSKAVFGATSSFAFMYNRNRSNYLKYQDDGKLLFEGATVWHSSNAPWALIPVTIDCRSLDLNTYYPVTIGLPYNGLSHIECYNFLSGASRPSWSTHPSGFSVLVVWEENPSGWGTIGVYRNVHAATYSWSNVYPVGNLGQITNASMSYLYVRGGGVYYFKVTNGCSVVLRTSTCDYSGQSVSPTTSVTFPSVNYGSSDQTLKKNIQPISSILPIVLFNWKDTNIKSYGFIAQDLKKSGLNDLVYGEEGLMTINYNGALAYYLAKLSNIVEENNININNRINILEKRILDLELENQDLKNKLEKGSLL